MIRCGGNTPPLVMWRHMLGGGAPAVDAYAVGGNAPEFVADFAGTLNSGTEYYRSGGSETTFSSVFTHSGLVAPATMTDSDGVLKWAPHNLIEPSNDFADSRYNVAASSITSTTQPDPDGGSAATLLTSTGTFNSVVQVNNFAVKSGQTYTWKIFVKQGTSPVVFVRAATTGGIGINANYYFTFATESWNDDTHTTAVSVGNGFYLLTLTCTPNADDNFADFWIGQCDASGSATVTTGRTMTIYGAHLYRSDLGGMVNNPDRGDSYVPTTTAARYLPRRNNYIYNGSTYDNAGILVEPAAATNLHTNTNDWSASSWTTLYKFSATAGQTTGPDGLASGFELAAGTGGGADNSFIAKTFTATASTAYTFSVYLKANTLSWTALGINQFDNGATAWIFFNLSTGSIGSTIGTGLTGSITNCGGGWYRCSVTYSGTTTDLSGRYILFLAEGDNDVVVAQDGKSIYAYGPQLEVGSVPTSYIPTAGSTVTRAAETLTVAASLIEDTPTALCAHVSGRQTYVATNFEFDECLTLSISFGDGFSMRFQNQNTSSRLNFYGGQSQAVATWEASNPGGINKTFNFAARHSSAQIQAASSGSAGTAVAESNMSTFVSRPLEFRATPNAVFGPTIYSMARLWYADIGESGIEEAST